MQDLNLLLEEEHDEARDPPGWLQLIHRQDEELTDSVQRWRAKAHNAIRGAGVATRLLGGGAYVLDLWDMGRPSDDVRLTSAGVLGDDNAVRILARTFERDDISLSELDLGKDGESLAWLAAAGLCDLGALKVRITRRGRSLIRAIDHSAP